MAPISLAIVGAGGFGRETFDMIRHSDPHEEQFRILGFVDPDPEHDLLALMGAHYLGNDEDFLTQRLSERFLLAVGDPYLRETLAHRFIARGFNPVTFIHSAAVVGSNVHIGDGSIVSAQAVVMNGSRLGQFVHIDRSAAVGHDGRIGDFATLHPHAIASGRVALGARARLGTCACILPGLTVGEDVMVGAGAVVTSDLPPRTTALGVPARHSNR